MRLGLLKTYMLGENLSNIKLLALYLYHFDYYE